MGDKPNTQPPPKKTVIGVGDVGFTDQHAMLVSTFGLGSCIGILFHCTNPQFTGLLHYMLPDSTLAPDKAMEKPSMFADTGIEMLVKRFTENEVPKEKIKLFICGGASPKTQFDMFQIGKKNIQAAKDILSTELFDIHYEELGGLNNRTIHFDTKSSIVQLKIADTLKEICLT